MGRKIRLEQALESDPAPLRAPPDWVNAELAVVNGKTALHAGNGRLDGSWHRQDSDEFLLVLRGQLTVEFDDAALSAGPGEAILIGAGERHRAAVPDGCLLVSVEAAGMKRLEA